MSDSDIQNLQVKMAFLEDSLSKISDEFFIQQRELDDLKVKYAGLISKMHGMQSSDQGQAEIMDERPPHY
ncbi:MAG: SlyX protein [Arenicella sp.]|jgi:SlyX protein